MANTQTSFTGGDLNFRRLLDRGDNYRVELLAGYRQLHLGDELSTVFDATSTTTPQLPILSTRTVGGENISTSNNFYGPQLGLYASTGWNRFTLEGHVASALGVTVSDLDFVHGRTVTTSLVGNPLANPLVNNALNNPAALVALGVPPATVAAILPTTRALASNLTTLTNGTTTATRTLTGNTLTYLGVVGEGGMRVSYRATDHIRFSAGYSFLYWNNVRRAQEMFMNSPTQLRTQAVDFTTHMFSAGLDVRY